MKLQLILKVQYSQISKNFQLSYLPVVEEVHNNFHQAYDNHERCEDTDKKL